MISAVDFAHALESLVAAILNNLTPPLNFTSMKFKGGGESVSTEKPRETLMFVGPCIVILLL